MVGGYYSMPLIDDRNVIILCTSYYKICYNFVNLPFCYGNEYNINAQICTRFTY